MKRLHLGSGKVILPREEGWTNCDLFSGLGADVLSSVTALPFDAETFDLCYCAHVLEHVHRNAVQATLVHWRHLLKPGGTLRIAVPDFESICKHYRKHGDLRQLMGLLYGGQNHPLNVHTTTFDFTYLSWLLTNAGFRDIRRWDWRNTEHAAYDDYSRCYLPAPAKFPVMPGDEPEGMLMSLNLEATK